MEEKLQGIANELAGLQLRYFQEKAEGDKRLAELEKGLNEAREAFSDLVARIENSEKRITNQEKLLALKSAAISQMQNHIICFSSDTLKFIKELSDDLKKPTVTTWNKVEKKSFWDRFR